jgi:hypothetical protein
MKTPATRKPGPPAPDQVSAFIAAARSFPVVPHEARRLVFALDATGSREATWDQAAQIQAEMFDAAASLGGLEIQLAYYRGTREFQAGGFVGRSDDLRATMERVRCAAGQTQIGRVLDHVATIGAAQRVKALVFVGDAMEEDGKALVRDAGRLALLGIPAFLFHEGDDPVARATFTAIAAASGGACCRFDRSSAGQLRALLAAVAVYAAGGRSALTALTTRRDGTVSEPTRAAARLLIGQLR